MGIPPSRYFQVLFISSAFIKYADHIVDTIATMKKVDENTHNSFVAYMGFCKLHDEIGLLLRLPKEERHVRGFDAVQEYFDKFLALFEAALVLANVQLLYLKIVRSLQVKIIHGVDACK